MFIGVTGDHSSGKDTVAYYLVEYYDFVRLSLSDELRAEIGVNADRDMHVRHANAQRKKHGGDYFARKVTETIKQKGLKKAVIVSIRAKGELEHLKATLSPFILMYFTAPLELIYKRSRERKGPKDKISFEKFKEQMKVERTGADHEINLDWMKSQADVVIENTGTLEELYQQIDSVLEER